ncbi:MAG: leucine-rich repeat protein [Tyzzerella sp.]|nr:leucine-rich repeat protein [Tyzzerella sp.]
MNNKKSTKRTLVSSVLSLMLCIAMLIGTTFAWFTDTATSAGNKIQAGSLKIDLELLDKTTGQWNSVKESQSPIFTDDIIWEPGYTDVKILKVENEGNLALKWYAKFVSNFELTALANVIDVYVCPSETEELSYPEDRNLEGYTKAGTLKDFVNSISNTTHGILLPEKSAYLGIALKMQESAGNEYQNMNLGGAFDIQIFATQYTSEKDSFGPDYDKAAPWTGSVDTSWYNTADTEFVLTSAEELAGLAQLVNNSTDTFKGKTVKLGADIDLNDIPWTPIGNSSNGWNSKFNGTFNGTGYTISNLYITGEKGLGLFGYVGNAAHIEGVTIDGAYVSGYDYVGAVMGTGYLAANCLQNNVVKNATIIATPYLMADGVTYDGGAKAGAVAGYAINGAITGNKAINCSITAYRDLGGIVGMAAGENRSIKVSDNSVDGITLTYLSVSNYADNKENENMGDVVGRYDTSKVTVDNNSKTNVTRKTDIYYTVDSIDYTKNMDTGIVTLLKVTSDYTSDSLAITEGVNALAGGAFASNSTIKKVVIPASVTDFGGNLNATGTGASSGAFKGNNSVETVVLSEGMTEIPAAAFNQAKKITSVNIPSTVTKIGVDAFKCVTIENLVIPDNVTEIAYGSFRDMSELTTVTIEGNPVIANYAFRSCPKLETVYIKGENVTFSGKDGQVFTNNDHTNFGIVNVYVANESVKQGLLDATSNDARLNIMLCSFVSNANELATVADVLEKGGNVVLSTDVNGEAIGNSGYGKAGVVIVNGGILDGNGKTLDISGASGTWDCAVNPKSGTIKNLTVTGAFRGIFMSGASGDVVIDNCVLDGCTYTFNSDAGSKDYSVTIKNTTLNGWTSFSNVHKSVNFINCKFGEGNGYAFCRPYQAVTFENCAFEAGYVLDISKTTGIVLDNCTIDGVSVTLENIEDLIGGNEDAHLVPTNVTIK